MYKTYMYGTTLHLWNSFILMQDCCGESRETVLLSLYLGKHKLWFNGRRAVVSMHCGTPNEISPQASSSCICTLVYCPAGVCYPRTDEFMHIVHFINLQTAWKSWGRHDLLYRGRSSHRQSYILLIDACADQSQPPSDCLVQQVRQCTMDQELKTE